ncbi:MAG: hypothetical protein WKF75_12850 [Singulisphaera sp.]
MAGHHDRGALERRPAAAEVAVGGGQEYWSDWLAVCSEELAAA